MSFCLNCLNEFTEASWSDLFLPPILCPSCYRSLKPRFSAFRLDGKKAYSLYPYSEAFRNLLYRFKGCYDLALAPVFLCKTRIFLRFFFSSYVLVPAPSNEEDDIKRGFNHVHEIFKELGLPMSKAIAKTTRFKQAGSSREERLKVAERLALVDASGLKGRKVLFVDDVITTGSTARACRALIEEAGAKEVSFFFLSMVQKDRENSIYRPFSP